LLELKKGDVVQGQLAGPLETGHDKAVIRTTDGKEESRAKKHAVPGKKLGISPVTSAAAPRNLLPRD
jgi:hypothetical protein